MQGRAPALAALSGLLLAASFPSLDLGFLAWGALFPLLFALRGRTPGQSFRLGAITGIVFFGGSLHWLTHPLHAHGHLPLTASVLVVLLLAAYCSLYPALFSAVIAHLSPRGPAMLLLAAPATWTALELARTHVLSGFPWLLLGYSQYRSLPIIQIADLTGVYGISFLIVLVNVAAATFLGDRRRPLPLLLCLGVVGAVLVYGLYCLGNVKAGPRLRVAIVQGNIEQDRKWDPAYQADVIGTYERLSRSALTSQPDLLIWPETATPFSFGGSGRGDPELSEGLRSFVRSLDTPLLFGSPLFERRPDHTYELRNAAWLLDRDGSPAAVYHKLHLVPFGEYVPVKSVLFFLGKVVDAPGDFQAGGSHTVMELRPPSGEGAVALGTVICYEIIFPDLVRQFVERGTTVMTTITNDGWFGRTAAPHQHFAMAVLRAVENRVPVARAANTGVSGFIDPRGAVLGVTDIFTEAVLVRDIASAVGPRTFYTRYGDVFAWLCVIVSIVLIGMSLRVPDNEAGRR